MPVTDVSVSAPRTVGGAGRPRRRCASGFAASSAPLAGTSAASSPREAAFVDCMDADSEDVDVDPTEDEDEEEEAVEELSSSANGGMRVVTTAVVVGGAAKVARVSDAGMQAMGVSAPVEHPALHAIRHGGRPRSASAAPALSSAGGGMALSPPDCGPAAGMVMRPRGGSGAGGVAQERPHRHHHHHHHHRGGHHHQHGHPQHQQQHRRHDDVDQERCGALIRQAAAFRAVLDRMAAEPGVYQDAALSSLRLITSAQMCPHRPSAGGERVGGEGVGDDAELLVHGGLGGARMCSTCEYYSADDMLQLMIGLAGLVRPLISQVENKILEMRQVQLTPDMVPAVATHLVDVWRSGLLHNMVWFVRPMLSRDDSRFLSHMMERVRHRGNMVSTQSVSDQLQTARWLVGGLEILARYLKTKAAELDQALVSNGRC